MRAYRAFGVRIGLLGGLAAALLGGVAPPADAAARLCRPAGGGRRSCQASRQGQPRQYEVRRSTQTRNESVLLDAGTDVAPDSLAVSPDLVPWTRGGAPRAAPLR